MKPAWSSHRLRSRPRKKTGWPRRTGWRKRRTCRRRSRAWLVLSIRALARSLIVVKTVLFPQHGCALLVSEDRERARESANLGEPLFLALFALGLDARALRCNRARDHRRRTFARVPANLADFLFHLFVPKRDRHAACPAREHMLPCAFCSIV